MRLKPSPRDMIARGGACPKERSMMLVIARPNERKSGRRVTQQPAGLAGAFFGSFRRRRSLLDA